MHFLPPEEIGIYELPSDAVGALLVTSDEVAFLANAIAQARLAIEDWEFSSLTGAEPAQADSMRQMLVQAFRAHQPPQT